MKFLFWMILIACGILIIRYRFQIYHTTGDWSWADQYVGNTVNAISLIGAVFIFVGVAYPFGTFDTDPHALLSGGRGNPSK